MAAEVGRAPGPHRGVRGAGLLIEGHAEAGAADVHRAVRADEELALWGGGRPEGVEPTQILGRVEEGLGQGHQGQRIRGEAILRQLEPG